MSEIKKFISDTLKPKGNYEVKRALGVWSFHIISLYIFMPIIKQEFPVHEFVVWGFLAFSAACLAIALKEKMQNLNRDSFKETTTSETIITTPSKENKDEYENQ